jgi:transcriptional regulator with XRE-family HTH domain
MQKKGHQMDFYERLAILMKEKGVTHKTLENTLGISNGSVSKWSKSMPNIKTLKKLEEYFNVSVDYLLTGEEPKVDLSVETAKLVGKLVQDPEMAKALRKYFELSDEKKKHVIETINMLSEV